MKQILVFPNGNTAIIEGKKIVNKNANLAISSTITINKEEPIKVVEATPENLEKYTE